MFLCSLSDSCQWDTHIFFHVRKILQTDFSHVQCTVFCGVWFYIRHLWWFCYMLLFLLPFSFTPNLSCLSQPITSGPPAALTDQTFPDDILEWCQLKIFSMADANFLWLCKRIGEVWMYIDDFMVILVLLIESSIMVPTNIRNLQWKARKNVKLATMTHCPGTSHYSTVHVYWC